MELTGPSRTRILVALASVGSGIVARLFPPLFAAAICVPLVVHAYSHNFGELSSIHAAVMRNDAAFVAQWIREKRNVDEEYNDTRFCIHGCWEQMRKATPLMVAADRGNLPIVKMLVEAGADVNRESTYPPSSIPNEVPLPLIAVFDYAVGSGNLQLVEYLAKDPHLKRPPPHLAGNFKQAFAEACRDRRVQEGQFKIAEFLLAAYGPSEALGDLWMVSSSEKCIPIAQRLLDAGAKPDVIALSNAARHGITDLVRLYISKGVPVNELATGTEMAVYFRQPLIEAARGYHVQAMKALLDAGSDPNLANRFGSTPLAAVAQQAIDRDWRPSTEGCPDEVEAMRLLLDHGARAGFAGAVMMMDHARTSECATAKRAVLNSVRP
jgi:ankyrin repeat protein